MQVTMTPDNTINQEGGTSGGQQPVNSGSTQPAQQPVNNQSAANAGTQNSSSSPLQAVPTVQQPTVQPQPVVVEQVAQQASAADPFARLKKKQVAVPQDLQKVQTSTGAGTQETAKVKKGSKVSPKVFLIGCGGFFIFFLGVVFAGLYYAVGSSEFLQSIGLKIDDVKNILMIFASLFFGLIFFLGFYVFVYNIYKIITVKSKSKLKFILGLIGGIFILLMTIIAGTLSIQRIRALSGEQKIQTNLLLVPYIDTRDGQVDASKGIPLIAPLRMRYQLNKDMFTRNVIKQIGANANIKSLFVDCGNGQVIVGGADIYQQGKFFSDFCLFMDKGPYTLKLTVNYQNGQSLVDETVTFDVATFEMNAQIEVLTQEDNSYLNDKKNEYIIGVAPTAVDFKAKLLFTDLGLATDTILWDLNADGIADLENNSNFTYPFGVSKLHQISYRLPELKGFEDIWYTFDLRVLESDLPRCELKIENTDNDKKRTFTPKFDEFVDENLSYSYSIYDTRNDTFIERNKKETRSFLNYTFKNGGQYEVQVSYYTPDSQKGSCSPEKITVGYVGNNVTFDTKWRQDETTPFVGAGAGTPVIVDNTNNTITVTALPVILELNVTDIKPDPNADLRVIFDGKQIFSQGQKVFELNIGKLGTKELKFELTNNQGIKEEQIYSVNITRQPVKAFMKVDPMVGESPVEVVLDASISPLYDENDEIVYFTWDFGDGEIRQNLSQGKMKHTYVYDEDKQNGEYFPRVTIKTKLGFSDTYRLENAIIVKKPQKSVKINIDSHPLRQAKINDIVTYSIESDGQIEAINRDFGNTQTLGCADRSCATAPVRYDSAGVYEVRVEIQYADDTPVVSRTSIKVY